MVVGQWEKAFQPLAAFAATALPALAVMRLEGGHSINAEAVAGFDAAITGHLAACQRSGAGPDRHIAPNSAEPEARQ